MRAAADSTYPGYLTEAGNELPDSPCGEALTRSVPTLREEDGLIRCRVATMRLQIPPERATGVRPDVDVAPLFALADDGNGSAPRIGVAYVKRAEFGDAEA